MRNIKRFFPFLLCIILFGLLFPLVNQINFMQNDDWNRYLTVQNFLNGNFELLSVTAGTFYTQGFIGMAFAKVFGINRLPILTLLISVANFYLLTLICYKIFKLRLAHSVLIGLLLFFNPLHVYSILGFMTENYLLFFALLGLYFYYKKSPLSNIWWGLGFFAKQSIIAIPVGLGINAIVKKDYKKVFITFLIFGSILVYYFFLFPRTIEMTGQKEINLKLLTYPKYAFSHIYASFTYFALFSFPLLVQIIKNSNRKNLSMAVPFTVLAYFGVMALFLSTQFYFKEFPYYPNIFTNKGFFLQGLNGIKVSAGIYPLIFQYLDKVALFAGILTLILSFRKLIKPEIFVIATAMAMFIVTPFMFDRYLLIFIPIIFIFLIKLNGNKFNTSILLIGLILESFISIDYGLEYIQRQKIIWNEANRINVEMGITKNQIDASHAWNNYHGVSKNNAIYRFSFSQSERQSVKTYSSAGIFETSTFILEKLNQ